MRWKTERDVRDEEILISGRSKNLEELTHVCKYLVQYSKLFLNQCYISLVASVVHSLMHKCYFLLSLNFVCNGISNQLSLKRLHRGSCIFLTTL